MIDPHVSHFTLFVVILRTRALSKEAVPNDSGQESRPRGAVAILSQAQARDTSSQPGNHQKQFVYKFFWAAVNDHLKLLTGMMRKIKMFPPLKLAEVSSGAQRGALNTLWPHVTVTMTHSIEDGSNMS